MTWTSTRWLCVAALLAATACGDDGEQGPPGMDGAPGADGAVGPAGSAGMQGAPGNDGADGSDGTDGSDGRNALLTQTPVGPGEDCVFGGLRVDSGVDDNGDGVLDEAEIDATSFICNDEAPFTLQLLHFADVDGNEATALANIDEFSALVDGLRGDPLFGGFSLVVSSGDNVIPGPRWFAAENGDVRNLTGSNEPGHVDQLWLNELGVVASALGNHELDQGPGEFADSLQIETRGDARFPGTLFPYLAANVDFSGDRDLDARTGMDGDDARLMGGQVAGSAVIHVAGEDIGLVGVATPNLPAITTTGALTVAGSTAMISELAAAIQPTIDALTMDGIDKIVLLSHLQQLDFEKALAAELTDVDIIVAGGSNTRMGDATDLLFPGDDAFAEPYPFATTGMDGDPLLIVNVDGDYKYLGRLVVSFDDNGILIPATLDEEISGVFASVPENVRAVAGQPIPRVVEVRDAVQEVITTQFENVVGHTDVYLEGRRGFVRTEETNLGNLTADSMKWYAERCTELTNVLAIKNGGGIRAEIGNVVVTGETVSLFPPFNDGVDSEAGDVSEGHFRGTLRFDNGLVILDVTGEELKLILEHGVAATGPTSTPGQFPQVGGISFGYDPTGTPLALTFDGDGNVTGIATPGGRISDLYVDTDANGTPDTALYVGGVAQPAASSVYTIVTLNFLANGGDDYPYALLTAPNRRQIYADIGFGDPDTAPTGTPDFPVLTACDPGLQNGFSSTGGEQDALAEYFLAFFPDPMTPFDVAETAPEDDRRIQDLSVIPTFVVP